MNAKRREIYARAAVQLRSHERPAVAESLCPGAMGMYLFLLLQARGEGSNGDVGDVIAMAHWAGSAAYRKLQAEALIAAGLVERRDGRLWIVRYAEHNDDAAAIAANRAASAKRQQKHRNSTPSDAPGDADVTRDTSVSNAFIPISSSISISGSGSRSGSDAREDIAQPEGPSPDFAVGTASAMRAGEVFADAVSAATGAAYVLDRAPFTVRDLCTALGHRPKGSTLTASLDWLRVTVGAWVASGEATPATPRRFNDWLNSRHAPRRTSGPPPASGPRSIRQPHDSGWVKRKLEREAREGTNDDFGDMP